MFAKTSATGGKLCLRQLRFESFRAIRQIAVLNQNGVVNSILAPRSNIGLKNLCFYSKKATFQVTNYEEVKDLPNHPEKLLIDVREPAELQEFGVIPTSINIPLADVGQELSPNVRAGVFKTKYGRDKPKENTEIIFHCRSGKRSGMAAETAVSLGYNNVKNYEGSWIDWAEHESLPK